MQPFKVFQLKVKSHVYLNQTLGTESYLLIAMVIAVVNTKRVVQNKSHLLFKFTNVQ